MTKELTQGEKTLLVESKIRTCTLMQEALESYLLEETDPDVIKQYQDGIEEYKNIINALKAFKETC
jgi:hypothetical protein